jgi:8-oxo-dGTP diphosphatase
MAAEKRLDVALVVLYDARKQLLLQHRTDDAAILPGYWAFFGGGIVEGESPEDAVRREAREELNVELVSPRLFIEQDFTIGDAGGHMRVFMDAYYGDKSALVLREGQGWGWFRASETEGLKMVDHDREIVRKIGQHIEDI